MPGSCGHSFIMQQLLPKRPIVSFLARGNFGKFYSRRHASTKTTDPLRILFCGSDAFSIASLQALVHEQRSNPKLIASIDVVCKTPKRVGRGLKVLREGMINWEATSLVDVKMRMGSALGSGRKGNEFTTARDQFLHAMECESNWQVYSIHFI